MPIDLLTLRLLVAVVEEQSVAKAAGREHIAASAVSKRIADLEKTLKVQRALEDGIYVAVFSEVHMKPGDLGVGVVHMFRFEGERIVELWDVGQPVPAKAVNEHGMF